MNNAAHDELEELLPIVESFKFPYCDMAHEDVIRTPEGVPIIHTDGKAEYESECPPAKKSKNPACAHCPMDMEMHPHVVLQKLSIILQKSTARGSEQLTSLLVQFKKDALAIWNLDQKIRSARISEEDDYGRTNLKNPYSQEQAIQNAAPLVREHRAIVDRMRHFRDTLVAMARE